MDDENVRRRGEQRDRRKIRGEVIAWLAIQSHVHGMRDVAHQNRITIGCRARRNFSSDVRAGTRPVVHDDSLADVLAEFLADNARERVRAAARWKWQDVTDRLRRIFQSICAMAAERKQCCDYNE